MKLEDLQGKTLLRVLGAVGEAEFGMLFDDGTLVKFHHRQDCCESVSIESIVGDLQDLIGTPLLLAEESSSDETPAGCDPPSESATWTFYKFATIKGYVDIRWIGESNGYYSESVDMAIGKLEIHDYVKMLSDIANDVRINEFISKGTKT